MKRAYRYRFYPSPEQAEQLSRTFGCVRAYPHRARLDMPELRG
ncbi:helix-turn-helix domain-containing protein [Micromonospora sp. NPDC005299]